MNLTPKHTVAESRVFPRECWMPNLVHTTFSLTSPFHQLGSLLGGVGIDEIYYRKAQGTLYNGTQVKQKDVTQLRTHKLHQ